MWEFRQLVSKSPLWLSRQLKQNCKFYHFPPAKFALRGTKSKKWRFRSHLKVIKNSLTPCWTKRTDWFLREACLLFRKNETTANFWFYRSIMFPMRADSQGTTSPDDVLQIQKKCWLRSWKKYWESNFEKARVCLSRCLLNICFYWQILITRFSVKETKRNNGESTSIQLVNKRWLGQ